jgi:signal transduction histidine kinase
MLRRERAPEEYRTALEAIDRNIDEMTGTVDALMAAARHEAGLTRDTSDVASAVRATVAATPPSPRVPVRVHVPERPLQVSADHDLLVRMVQPLVDNARRYGRSAVDVSVAQVGSSAEIEVADDGPGVTAEELERIFEPGMRGSAGRTADGGAGLGLALARRLARSVGGDITAGADVPGGRFTLRLPLA